MRAPCSEYKKWEQLDGQLSTMAQFHHAKFVVEKELDGYQKKKKEETNAKASHAIHTVRIGFLSEWIPWTHSSAFFGPD